MGIYPDIEKFVNSVFQDAIMNEDLQESKEELKVNMNDRFIELVEIGLSNDEAFKKVVESFGSIEEIRNSFGIVKKFRHRKRKLVLFVFFITIILSMFGAKIYIQQREYFAEDLFATALKMGEFSLAAQGSNQPYYDSIAVDDIIERLRELNDYLVRDMNYFENKSYENTENKLFLNSSISIMQDTLISRKTYGYWTELDQEVYDRYCAIVEDLSATLSLESLKIEGLRGHGDYFWNKEAPTFLTIVSSSFNVNLVDQYYRDLNELATCYITYNELPENVNLLNSQEIAVILKDKFKSYVNVQMAESVMTNAKAVDCTYGNIYISGTNFTTTASVDAADGSIKLLDFTSFENQDAENNVYDNELVGDLVKEMADNNLEYEITYLEDSSLMDVDFSNLYAYQVVPVYEGYKVFYQYNNPEVFLSRFDDSRIVHAVGNGLEISTEDFGTSSVSYDESKALSNALANQSNLLSYKFGNEYDESQFEYATTAYMYSELTGKYDLVHIYELPTSNLLLMINAETGKIE